MASAEGEWVSAYVLPLGGDDLRGQMAPAMRQSSSHQRSDQQPMAIEILRTIFGMTPTEAKVAYATSLGENAPRAGVAHGTTVEAIRFHLKNSYVKAGVTDKTPWQLRCQACFRQCAAITFLPTNIGSPFPEFLLQTDVLCTGKDYSDADSEGKIRQAIAGAVVDSHLVELDSDDTVFQGPHDEIHMSRFCWDSTTLHSDETGKIVANLYDMSFPQVDLVGDIGTKEL